MSDTFILLSIRAPNLTSMYKKQLLIIFFLLLGLKGFSQLPDEINVYAGINNSEIGKFQEVDGGGSYHPENNFEIGVQFLLDITDDLALETGINFWRSDVVIHSAPFPEIYTSRERLEITSIPIFANYSFLNYFYVNGGPVMDFQLSDNTFDSTSGIGVGFGAGAKYHFENFAVFLNPNLRIYSVIPFEEESNHRKLSSLGLRLGFGYRF